MTRDLDRLAPGLVHHIVNTLGWSSLRPLQRAAIGPLLDSAGLLKLWRDGYVEPVHPPATPRHIAAQQILALCLQEGRLGDATWQQWWGELPIFDETAPQIAGWLVETSHLVRDDAGMLSIGPEAERRYGRRNFSRTSTRRTHSPRDLA